jgi:hypothetical protein
MDRYVKDTTCTKSKIFLNTIQMQEMKLSFYLLIRQLHSLGRLPHSNSELISDKLSLSNIWQESLHRGLTNRKASIYTKHKPEITAHK